MIFLNKFDLLHTLSAQSQIPTFNSYWEIIETAGVWCAFIKTDKNAIIFNIDFLANFAYYDFISILHYVYIRIQFINYLVHMYVPIQNIKYCKIAYKLIFHILKKST